MMKAACWRVLFAFMLASLLMTGCVSIPCVVVYHSPVIAKSSETVTFTATVCNKGAGPGTVQILVNAALAQTCNNVGTGGTCTYTGGPYAAYQGTTVSYLAKYTDSAGKTATKGYYYFAVTDKNYKWGLNYLPARDTGTTSNKIDLVFHRAKDYDNTSTTFDAFIDDVEAKMYNVYRQQAKIKLPSNFDAFNFYVYSKAADVSDLDTSATHCGTVDSGANTDMPWRDVDAILHAATHGDCTIPALTQFTAEGSMTKAFLHESGHAVFKMADEYDAAPTCYTGYFQPTNEPNIFQSQAACQAEQTARQRNTNACRKFTTCQSGWWGIHGASDNTVMQRGDVGDPWGIEGGEHVDWFFTQY